MKLQESLENGPHRQLLQLIGKWKGTSKVWFDIGDPIDTAEVEGEFSALMDGRFILHQYTTTFQSTPITGMMWLGCFMGTDTYQSAWIDSFHTGSSILFSQSKRNNNDFDATGSYTAGEKHEQTWGWRTKVEWISADEVKMIAYNITPDGEEQLATEMHYHRVI